MGVALETMLLTPVIEPLVAGCEAIGTYGAAELAGELAQSDAGRFAALLRVYTT